MFRAAIAAVVVTAAPAEGCLWAPDVQERGGPVESNAITLDRSKVEPDPDTVFFMTETTTFSVAAALTLSDGGLGPVRYSWFVDYLRDPFPALYRQSLQPTLIINPCTEGFQEFFGFGDKGVHVLELIASTEDIEVDLETGIRTLPASYVYVLWYLDLRGLKCPGVLP